ncbi:acyl-CoA dehydrogenase [Methylocapsa sp. S129]|uniref:acyl-CoA dehydrogenase n=1 Tax=Methylocapsa sp. S129 TaxID=1641869 RepID=UPI00131D4254|nr:acyl-CoA dehydrogenase [Methylocapsa sp. S129]
MNEIATGATAETSTRDWREWVGREEMVCDLISPERVAALAATLDLDDTPGRGDALPPGWHWIFFNPFMPRRALGPDGHPKRGGFLPPVTLPRRMWAGGRLACAGSLIVGAEAVRKSTISRVETKSGRAGQLVFVTVTHHFFCDGKECVTEEQDIVYRGSAAPGGLPPTPTHAPDGAQWTERVEPDTTLLFRYSALTFNGHRIHYDQHYAQREEHYPDLVVHGPLTATLLLNFATRLRRKARLEQFEFRGVSPLFVSSAFTLEAKISENDLEALDLWARGPSGELAMRASARFSL